MKRSTTFRLIAAIAIGISAFASAGIHAVSAGFSAAARWLMEPLTSLRIDLQAEPQKPSAPAVMLVRASTFRLRRLMRRVRVDVQPSYRNCPSI